MRCYGQLEGDRLSDAEKTASVEIMTVAEPPSQPPASAHPSGPAQQSKVAPASKPMTLAARVSAVLLLSATVTGTGAGSLPGDGGGRGDGGGSSHEGAVQPGGEGSGQGDAVEGFHIVRNSGWMFVTHQIHGVVKKFKPGWVAQEPGAEILFRVDTLFAEEGGLATVEAIVGVSYLK